MTSIGRLIDGLIDGLNDRLIDDDTPLIGPRGLIIQPCGMDVPKMKETKTPA